MSLEKTCKVCAWSQDGYCKKPNRNTAESMSECFVDPLEIKNLITKYVDSKSWEGVSIPSISPTKPIVWED